MSYLMCGRTLISKDLRTERTDCARTERINHASCRDRFTVKSLTYDIHISLFISHKHKIRTQTQNTRTKMHTQFIPPIDFQGILGIFILLDKTQ